MRRAPKPRRATVANYEASPSHQRAINMPAEYQALILERYFAGRARRDRRGNRYAAFCDIDGVENFIGYGDTPTEAGELIRAFREEHSPFSAFGWREVETWGEVGSYGGQ